MAYPPKSVVTYNKAEPSRSEAGERRGMGLLKAVKQIPNEITLTWKKRDGVSEASELRLNDCGHTSLSSQFHALIKVIK